MEAAPAPGGGPARLPAERRRDVLLALSGVLALVLKSRLAPFAGPLFHDYAGNVAASFAVFFIVKLPSVPARVRTFAAAALALLATGSFEATNGFGFMSNTYDPWDFAANVVGVGLAAAVNAASTRR